MGEKDYIQENIVGRKEGLGKKLLHYLRVIVSALLFGILSAASFAWFMPHFDRYFHPAEPVTVALETETEEAAAVQSAASQAAGAVETEASEGNAAAEAGSEGAGAQPSGTSSSSEVAQASPQPEKPSGTSPAGQPGEAAGTARDGEIGAESAAGRDGSGNAGNASADGNGECIERAENAESAEHSENGDSGLPGEGQAEAGSEASLEQQIQMELAHYHFTVSNYETMRTSLQRVANVAEAALCEVKRRTSGTDVLGLELFSEASFSGILFAQSLTELLIMAPIEAVEGVEAVQATLLREYRHEASIKAVDRRDGIAVLAIPIDALGEEELERLSPIPLGSSRRLRRGETLFAIGAPAGRLYSTAFGSLSYHAYNTASLDSTAETLLADLRGRGEMGTFILNTAGELVGWVGSGTEDAGSGYQRIEGISDYLHSLQSLSNGAAVPYLGTRIMDVDKEMEEQGIPGGVIVLGTEEQSPAFLSGIQAGDVVVRMGESEIPDSAAFEKVMEEAKAGDRLPITVLRQGGAEYAELSFEAVLGER